MERPHLRSLPPRRIAPVAPTPADAEAVVGAPLTVVFAEGDAIEEVRRGATNALPLEPPFHVSEDDRYLVLPDDIGMEIVDILEDGDAELLGESLRDGLVVRGSLGRGVDGMELVVDERVSPGSLVADRGPRTWVATVPVGPGEQPLFDLAVLPHLQCTVVSALFDQDGLEAALEGARSPASRELGWIGRSWCADRSAGAAPTGEASFAWARVQEDGRVGVELALFVEYDEVVALFRPVRFE